MWKRHAVDEPTKLLWRVVDNHDLWDGKASRPVDEAISEILDQIVQEKRELANWAFAKTSEDPLIGTRIESRLTSARATKWRLRSRVPCPNVDDLTTPLSTFLIPFVYRKL
jgi:hypothetical protein